MTEHARDQHLPLALGEPDFAQRTVMIWHVLFGAMVLAAGIFLTIDGHAPVAIPLLAVLVVAYVVLAAPAVRCDDVGRSVLYLVIAVGITLVLEWQDPAALVLLFTIYSQIFVLLDRRNAIIATVIVSLSFSLVLVALDGWTRDAWVVHGFTAAGNIAFALLIGLFIDGIVRESSRRKQLLVELQETRDELAAAEREAGAVAERERLARDIHDTLAQGFTSIVMLAQAGEAASARGDDTTARRRLHEIQSTARDNLAEARALVAAMSPPALADDGLVAALTRLTDRHAAETGTTVRFEVVGEPRPLAPSSEVTALRSAQECLANVRRHSSSGTVDVVLAYDEDGATVTVSDDGIGFDTTSPRHGYGLDGLSARVDEVGGLIDIESGPGAGTRVKVRVP